MDPYMDPYTDPYLTFVCFLEGDDLLDETQFELFLSEAQRMVKLPEYERNATRADAVRQAIWDAIDHEGLIRIPDTSILLCSDCKCGS